MIDAPELCTVCFLAAHQEHFNPNDKFGYLALSSIRYLIYIYKTHASWRTGEH